MEPSDADSPAPLEAMLSDGVALGVALGAELPVLEELPPEQPNSARLNIARASNRLILFFSIMMTSCFR